MRNEYMLVDRLSFIDKLPIEVFHERRRLVHSQKMHLRASGMDVSEVEGDV